MDFDALYNAGFDALDSAVDDWSRLVRNLTSLEKDARNGLQAQANRADWSGINATVSRQFVGKTAGEFADARTQASSIRNILRDTAGELRSQQRKLKDAIERGAKNNLTVTQTGGGGFTVTMRVHPDRAGRGSTPPDHGEAEVTRLRDEVQDILEAATRSDDSAGEVLRALVNQSKHGFSGASYGDRDSAAKAVREADALARLAAREPGSLSNGDLDRLSAGLKRYHGDELFAARFAAELGAKGTLEFWAGVNAPEHGITTPSDPNPALAREREKRFGDLQQYLGMTLANATQSDSAAMTDWKRDMLQLGDQPVGGRQGFHQGFQVMSSLMRSGDYDDRFLQQYGERLVAFEKKHGEDGKAPHLWQHLGHDPRLNHTGTDAGADPFTGFMKALANSPDAATSFFGDTFQTASEAGKGTSVSNFDYFFETRDWPHDVDDAGKSSTAGRDTMAQALEAAVTGHPAGELPTADTPPHTKEQAKLMEQVVSSLSEEPKRLLDHRYTADSVGQMMAEYMPDVHRGLGPGQSSDPGLYPVAGTAASLSQQDLTRVLYSLGQVPEGYASVLAGQQSYTANIMEYHFRNPDAHVNDANFKDMEKLKTSIEAVASTAGEIQGTTSAGRAYASEDAAGAKDAQFNSAIDKTKAWATTGVSIGIGIGASYIAGPAGIAVGGLAGGITNELLSGISQGSLRDSTDQAVFRRGEQLDETEQSTYKTIEMAARGAGEAAGNRSPHIEVSAVSAAEKGFGSAQDNVKRHLEGLGKPTGMK
ncbi:DUF6571 family protein [Streptomyces sp. NPDC002490]|uniref:DUF6571 family protein n=1 Tax=Streptomyces sp. NPDC002490 TaxID=3154416 RepID=UPI00331DF4A9